MAKQGRRKYIFLTLGLMILLIGGFIAVAYELREPPLDLLREADAALESARNAQAEMLAPVLFESATELLVAGRNELSAANASWWPFQSYDTADSLLTESTRFSYKAIQLCSDLKESRAEAVSAGVNRLKGSLRVWKEILEQSLPRVEESSLYRRAAMIFEVSERMLRDRQYEAAARYADSVVAALERLSELYDQHMTASEHWMRAGSEWAALTVEKSQLRRSRAILVDKKKHYLYVLENGRVTDSMLCDLGYNSGRQKRKSGDGATPEGMYKVSSVNKFSKYYRALLLDYPNREDRTRFESNRLNGVIPHDAKIGGLIEIHGHGGTGKDWTDGCVAVTDRHMDSLLKIAGVGTPVTIVREWMNR